MKTAFAMRIDTDKIMNEELDEDYFNNLQRHTKYQKIDTRVKDLEAKFKSLTTGKDIKLAQLMQQPEIKELLVELRSEKKKLEKLQHAMKNI